MQRAVEMPAEYREKKNDLMLVYLLCVCVYRKLLYLIVERNVRRAVVILLLYRIKLILMFFGCKNFKVVLLLYTDHDWPVSDRLLAGYF